jgi:hypothetical protein
VGTNKQKTQEYKRVITDQLKWTKIKSIFDIYFTEFGLRIYLDIHIYFYHRVDTTDIVSYHPLSSQCFNVILHDSINIFIIGTNGLRLKVFLTFTSLSLVLPLTTVLPVLFKYCYKYCYSDSRKL